MAAKLFGLDISCRDSGIFCQCVVIGILIINIIVINIIIIIIIIIYHILNIFQLLLKGVG